MARIVFFCHVPKKMLETVEFYRQDIEALKTLGHKVTVCTTWLEIPFRFDVIYIWWWTYAAWPIVVSKILRRPSIITGTFDFKPPGEGRTKTGGKGYFDRPFYERFLIAYAVKSATRNLFVNQIEYEGWSEYFKISSQRYFPHVLTDEYLQGPGPERELALFSLCWSERLNLERKGIYVLLEAIKKLKDEGIYIKLYLAGHRGNGYEHLCGVINRYNVSDRVSLLGEMSRDDKIRMLRTCELYVQPSYFEGFGVAIAEAMGAGACIITCNVGAVADTVGDTALFITPGAVDELSAAIKNVCTQDNLRKDYQKRAFVKAKKDFSFAGKTDRLKKILYEIGVL